MRAAYHPMTPSQALSLTGGVYDALCVLTRLLVTEGVITAEQVVRACDVALAQQDAEIRERPEDAGESEVRQVVIKSLRRRFVPVVSSEP